MRKPADCRRKPLPGELAQQAAGPDPCGVPPAENPLHEPGKVFSREQLLNHLYDDYRVVTDRTIDSHIKNLRRKLEALDAEQSFIRAVYGVGYRWEADVQDCLVSRWSIQAG
jgi:hypothetical protein